MSSKPSVLRRRPQATVARCLPGEGAGWFNGLNHGHATAGLMMDGFNF